MPRYEIKYFVDFDRELTDGEIAGLAHDTHTAIGKAPKGLVGRPVERRIYIRREYQPHEERALVAKHAEADFAAGRDWNTAAGCSCALCAEYRKLGYKLHNTERGIEMPLRGHIR